MLNNEKPINALSVDVEDYFQVAAFKDVVNPADWQDWPSRVERNTDRLLQLFSDHNVRATFFVLGWVAEKFPELVRRIVAADHELACHGYGHQLIYEQRQDEFREETIRAKLLLEEAGGVSVKGYRAASYSITKQSEWAVETLMEVGFAYDSSIVPVKHDLYGYRGAPSRPYRLVIPGKGEIAEFPPSTLELLGIRIPVGGGGYFRLFPYMFSRWALRQLNDRRQSFVFYLHPWEIDTEQPRIDAKWTSKFRHYNNLGKCEARLKQLLRDFEFTTLNEALQSQSLPAVHFPFQAAPVAKEPAKGPR